MDNVMIERLWPSVKYDCVYLHAFETGSAARAGIGKWMTFYNTERPFPHVQAEHRPRPIKALTYKRQHDQKASLAAPQTCPGNGGHLSPNPSLRGAIGRHIIIVRR
ncbi:integrase core domain-containing protein [Yangia mangrovi]|nr:integrase core domain-containing protein [Alloyangia mangrovi]